MSFESMLIHRCTVVHKSVDQELYYDNKTENFIVGDIITGQTSGVLGKLESIIGGSNGIMVLNGVSGSFVDNETITGAKQGSAMANGTNFNHMDEYGQLYLTESTVMVGCRFHSLAGDMINKSTGDVYKSLPSVILPASIDPVIAERIIGLSEGFERTYTIQNSKPAYVRGGLHHWTCKLVAVE